MFPKQEITMAFSENITPVFFIIVLFLADTLGIESFIMIESVFSESLVG